MYAYFCYFRKCVEFKFHFFAFICIDWGGLASTDPFNSSPSMFSSLLRSKSNVNCVLLPHILESGGLCVHPSLMPSNVEGYAVDSKTSRIRYMMMMILLCSLIRCRSIRPTVYLRTTWYFLLHMDLFEFFLFGSSPSKRQADQQLNT